MRHNVARYKSHVFFLSPTIVPNHIKRTRSDAYARTHTTGVSHALVCPEQCVLLSGARMINYVVNALGAYHNPRRIHYVFSFS